MRSARAVLINKAGLHARSSAKLMEVAAKFSSDITVGAGSKQVSGKSILALMMLAATCGTELTLHAEGTDEDAAIEALLELIADGFGELDQSD